MSSYTVDWLIGNTNLVVLDNFRDSATGEVANDVEAYCSLCNPASKTITNATNLSPIVVTSPAHGLTTNQVITLINVAGNGATNGTFPVTVIDANTFSLQGSAGSGAYTGGGQWYACVAGGSAVAFSLSGNGRYQANVPNLPLTVLTNYLLVVYCLGTYRDIYNEVITVVARMRGT